MRRRDPAPYEASAAAAAAGDDDRAGAEAQANSAAAGTMPEAPDEDDAVQAWPPAGDAMLPLAASHRDGMTAPALPMDDVPGGPLSVPSELPPTLDDAADGHRR